MPRRNPELEARLDDREACRVYADWLQTEQDPLGEVMALALAAEEEAPRLRKLKVWAKQALDAYIESYWIPQFPELAERFRAWNKGVKPHVETEANDAFTAAYGAALQSQKKRTAKLNVDGIVALHDEIDIALKKTVRKSG
jgi:hypothetical protein